MNWRDLLKRTLISSVKNQHAKITPVVNNPTPFQLRCLTTIRSLLVASRRKNHLSQSKYKEQYSAQTGLDYRCSIVPEGTLIQCQYCEKTFVYLGAHQTHLLVCKKNSTSAKELPDLPSEPFYDIQFWPPVKTQPFQHPVLGRTCFSNPPASSFSEFLETCDADNDASVIPPLFNNTWNSPSVQGNDVLIVGDCEKHYFFILLLPQYWS